MVVVGGAGAGVGAGARIGVLAEIGVVVGKVVETGLGARVAAAVRALAGAQSAMTSLVPQLSLLRRLTFPMTCSKARRSMYRGRQWGARQSPILHLFYSYCTYKTFMQGQAISISSRPDVVWLHG
jgi:hypothetical protein